MKKTDKERWLQDLRSGAYLQGEAALRFDNGMAFCCLGVYLHGKGVPLNEDEWESGYGRPDQNGLHPAFCEAGLDVDTCVKLAVMNDAGVPFADIANWIEDNIA